MLRSSHTLQRNAPAALATPKKNSSTLRKTRSSESIASSPQANIAYDFPEPPKTAGRFFGLAMKSTTSLAHYSDGESGNDTQYTANTSHSRGASVDIPRSSSKIHLPVASKSETAGARSHKGKSSKDLSPDRFAHLLSDSSSLTLDVEIVKKLRLLLRNEPARYSLAFFSLRETTCAYCRLSWTSSFLNSDGYSALLTRLNEILEVEWRSVSKLYS